MKWGIRRSPEQLGRKIEKLEKRNAKLSRKINPRDTEKADRMQVEADRASAKAYAARSEANKNRNRIKVSNAFGFQGKTFEKRANKYDKEADAWQEKSFNLQTKVNTIRSRQRAVLDEIYKNESIRDMYKDTLTALDEGKIKQGRFFMQYVREHY